METEKQSQLEILDENGNPTKGKPVLHVGDYSWVNPQTDISQVNLNWTEKELPEKVRTKHVHRLHPYLGKYVPQLVEIFLRKYNPKSILDPFCGSGTSLVQANELGISSIGSDTSAFNCLLSKVKTDKYDILKLEREVHDILNKTRTSLGSTTSNNSLVEEEKSTYLKEWFASKALSQLLTYRSFIGEYEYSDLLKIILTRSARSARMTKHFDLDFPKKPQTEPYYCHKHSRTCKPTHDALNFISRYSLDTIERIKEFSKLRTDSEVKIYNGDSREIEFPSFEAVITSPPYVGLIDYHEQHRYAFELLGLPQNKASEIGISTKGTSVRAKIEYANKISEVFKNARNSIVDNGVAIIVVHDKHELYANMAEKSGFELEKSLTRNVNRRTGRRNSEFFESILIWRAV